MLVESLEGRRLLAGDLISDYLTYSHHNWAVGTDVNGDYRTTPVDALQIINRLNSEGAGELAAVEAGDSVDAFYDVNADNRIDPVDALAVINRLNSGEGEDPLVRLSLDATRNGQSLVNPNTGQFTAGVGSIFDLELKYSDLRAPNSRFGAFTVYADILATRGDTFRPVVGETKRLVISADATGGIVTLSANGNTGQLDLSQVIRTSTIRDLFEQDLGFGNDTVEVYEPGRDASDPRQFFITFVGLPFEDIVDVTVDDSQVTPGTATVTISDIPALLDVGTANERVNPESLLFNINRSSFSFEDLDTGETVSENFYTNILSGSFPDDNLFDEVGGAGSTNNLNQVDPDLAPIFPFEVLSIPIEVLAGTTSANPATFSVRPADETGHEITLYGNEEAVPNDLIELGQTLSGVFSQQLTAVDDPVTVAEDSGPRTIAVLANDMDDLGEAITLDSLVTQPTLGVASINGSQIVYTPSLDAVGQDVFTYQISNESGNTTTAQVTVTITPINDPPTAPTPVPAPTTNEDTPVTITSDTLLSGVTPGGGADEAGQEVIVTSANSTGQGAVTLNADGSITYTPADDFFGNDTFTYTLSDQSGGNSDTTVSVTVSVTSVNDPPTLNDFSIDAVEDQTTTFSAAEVSAELAANGSAGPANENQTLSPVSGTLTGSAGGTLTVNGDGSVTYNPAANFFGSETFTISVTDGQANTTAVLTVNVQGVNDAPIAVDDNLVVDEGVVDESLDVLDNDLPGPGGETGTLTIVSVTQPSQGSVEIAADNQSVIFNPPSATFLGTVSFTYTVSDGELQSTATVVVEVQPTIRPRARGDQFSVNEDSGTTNLDVLANDQPNDGSEATLETIGTVPASQGTIAINDNGTPADKTDDTVAFAPAGDFFGQVTFTYTISDTGAGVQDSDEARAAARGTVTVTVEPVNDPPIANNDGAAPNQIFAEEDTPLEINGSVLTQNDSPGPANESGQTLTVTAVSSPTSQGGTALLNGTIVYTPAADFTGEDTFTYTVSDGAGGTATATATITVVEVNDPPIANPDSARTDEDVVLTINASTLLNNDTAVEANQTLSLTAVSSQSSQGGNVSLAGGVVTYQPPADFFGTDTFTYTIDDGQVFNSTAQGTVNVTVDPVNDPPIAVDDVDDPATSDIVEGVVTFKNVTKTFSTSVLLANDSAGPANESDQELRVTQIVADNGNQGTLQFDVNNQTFTYTPPTDQSGFADSFTYSITDGQSAATARFEVTVLEFQPSQFSGSISIQSNNNKLSGTEVRLTGQSVLGPLERVTFVDANGEFNFGNVPPNAPGESYLITLTPPEGVIGETQTFTVTVGEEGGLIQENINFTVGGLDPQRGAKLDLLISSYVLGNPDLADPALFNSGGVAGLDTEDDQLFFSVIAGYEGARFVEVDLNAEHTQALISYVEEGTNRVLTATLPKNRYIVLEDPAGATVRIFGGIENFDFTEVDINSVSDPAGFDDYLDATRDYFASLVD